MTGSDSDILKIEMNKLFAKLSPEHRALARASIDKMRTGTSQEDLLRIRDEEIDKLKK